MSRFEQAGVLEQGRRMEGNAATEEDIHGVESAVAIMASEPESSSRPTEGLSSSPSNAADVGTTATNEQPLADFEPVSTGNSLVAGTGRHSSHLTTTSEANGHLLSTIEKAPYTYTCHKESIPQPARTIHTKLTSKFGRHFRGRRMTPAKPRGHNDISAKNVPGDLFKILANECMEQLYDDNFDGKFGAVHVLAFSRLHHMNLHYFEAELAAELASIGEKKNTDREQMLRIRKTLRDYSKSLAVLRPIVRSLRLLTGNRRGYRGL